MNSGKAKARPKRAHSEPQALLRQLQVAVAVAKCVAIAAEYSEADDIDVADAVAGLLQLMQPATSMLDREVPHGRESRS